jgi:hypothetical protein
MSDPRIMFAQILPNCLSPIIVTGSLMVATAILTESALSFLGLGDPNVMSWGFMIGAGRTHLRAAWLSTIPGNRHLPHRARHQPGRRGAVPHQRPALLAVLAALLVPVHVPASPEALTPGRGGCYPGNVAGIDAGHARPPRPPRRSRPGRGVGPNCQRLVPHRRGWSPWHWPLCRQGCTSRSYAYISKELGPAGILVNVVMPGATLTKRNVAVLPAAIREQMEKASPISRLLPPSCFGRMR